jgi:hypothetical protein
MGQLGRILAQTGHLADRRQLENAAHHRPKRRAVQRVEFFIAASSIATPSGGVCSHLMFWIASTTIQRTRGRSLSGSRASEKACYRG